MGSRASRGQGKEDDDGSQPIERSTQQPEEAYRDKASEVIDLLRKQVLKALVIRSQSNPEETAETLLGALESAKAVYGVGHPQTAKIMFDLSISLVQMNQMEEAILTLRKCTNIFKSLRAADYMISECGPLNGDQSTSGCLLPEKDPRLLYSAALSHKTYTEASLNLAQLLMESGYEKGGEDRRELFEEASRHLVTNIGLRKDIIPRSEVSRSSPVEEVKLLRECHAVLGDGVISPKHLGYKKPKSTASNGDTGKRKFKTVKSKLRVMRTVSPSVIPLSPPKSATKGETEAAIDPSSIVKVTRHRMSNAATDVDRIRPMTEWEDELSPTSDNTKPPEFPAPVPLQLPPLLCRRSSVSDGTPSESPPASETHSNP